MIFMKPATILSTAIVALSLVACANKSERQANNESWQLSRIELWHECINDNLQHMNEAAGFSNPEESIRHTLIACRGHREDVLATFPLRMEHALDNLMVKQTYEAGYTAYAKEQGMSLPINSLTLDNLRRRHGKR